MAMPTSGCIGLRQCITGIACSSISCAVTGFMCTPTSLSSISFLGGKSPPYTMSSFYCYPLQPDIEVSVNANWHGTVGRSNGFMGTFRLMCGISVINSCYVGFGTTSVGFVWTNVPSGTYCVSFVDISAQVNSITVGKGQCWIISLSDNGTGDVTTPINWNASVNYCIWNT